MSFLKKVYQKWMSLIHVVGEFNTRIIFFLLFYSVLGIYALAMKLRFLLRRELKPATFWSEKFYQEPTLDLSKKQF